MKQTDNFMASSLWRCLLFTLIGLTACLGIQAKKEQKTISPFIQKGDSCMKEHDSQHAVFYYKQQLAEHPQDLDTRRKLASCYRMRGDSKQCVAVLDSIPADSLNHEDLRMFFYSYLNLGDNKNIGLYGSQINLKYPNDSEVFAALLSHWNNTGKPETVSAFALSYVQKKDSTNILINKELAYSLYLQLRYAQAIPMYKKLIAQGFDNFESNFVIGLCYYNLEKYKEAYTYLYKAADIKKDNPNMNNLFYLGMTCKKLAESEKDMVKKIKLPYEAIKYLEQSIDVAYPRSRGLYVNQQLADLYYKNLNYEKAGHAFAQCIEYDDEDDPHNYYNAAQMYIAAKMKPQAKLYLQMFMEKANKLNDEKEKAKLTAKAKEQLNNMK